MASKSKWVWMPHPGHFICASECKFHLTTEVGGYIVSTVGEYFPQESVREILAKCRGVVLEGKGEERERDYMTKIGYENLGVDGKYETMVFPSKTSDEACCPFTAAEWGGLAQRRYSSPGEAYAGHMEFCEEWGKKQ